MKIIPASQPIDVEHPVILIFGQPGICKTSLGYSCADPLLIDADQGAHRAVNRRDTLSVSSWADLEELSTSKGALDPYKTVVPDTIGRVLDMLAVKLMDDNPKYDRGGGNLSLPGFGALKAGFNKWLTRTRALGKDVVLLAHAKEDKDGDSVIVRPDVTGGSYAEIMKVADFVGFIYMRGKDRVLDFNPTDRWVGKNPAGWKPIVIPQADKATTLLAELMVKGREALGRISAEGAQLTAQIDDFRMAINDMTVAAEFDRALVDINKLPQVAALQVKKLLQGRGKTLGIVFDPKTRRFVDPPKSKPQPEPVGAGAGVDPELGF